MDDATRAGARPLRVVRILFRIVLVLALVVLLVLIGVKRAPSVLAAMSPGSPTTAVADGATSAEPTSTGPTSSAPVPTISVPTVTIPPSTGGGGGTGSGTTPSAKPVTQGPAVTSLSAADVACPLQPTGAPGASSVPTPEATVRWSTSGGTTAYFGVQTRDAQAAPYSSVDLSGSISIDFPCGTASQLYTITVVGPGGKASRSITVRNTGAVG